MERSSVIGSWAFLARHRIPSLSCALAGVWGWSGLVGFEPQILDYLVVGASMIAVYELNRITDSSEDAVNCGQEACLAERHHSRVLGTFLFAAVGAQLVALLRTPWWPSLIVAASLMLGIAYSVPVRRLGPTARLKAVPVVKNLAAAFGWAACVVLYPAFVAGVTVGARIYAAFTLMLLGTFVVEVIWDVRDVEGDAHGGVKTLPHLLGIRGSRILLQLVSLGAAVLIGLGCLAGQLPWKWSLLLVNAIAFVMMLGFLPDRVWRWRPMSNLVVILQAGLLLQLGLLARRS